MKETLQEFFDSRGVPMRVDREAGIIRGVKILGLESRNGRTYLPDALAQAARLYEEAKVNVNHPKGSPAGPRDYRDRIGVIRNVAHRAGEGLFADFHFNPRHTLAEQLIWDAEHAPENVGFSHNVEARTSRRGERVVVEAITKVQSVDLVADPATTRGLFESAGSSQQTAAAGLAGLTLEQLKRCRPDLVEALNQEALAELAKLRDELGRLEALEAAHQKQLLARRLLREFKLPNPDAADPQSTSVVSERFMESVLAAPSEQAMRDLIEERASLVQTLALAHAVPPSGACPPQSRDQNLVYGADRLDTKAFVEVIT